MQTHPTEAEAALARIKASLRKGALKIKTHFDPPPIPDRWFDWHAITEDYDLGSPIGYGATEAEAIADLKEQIEEDDEP